jgi:calcineurin-like phosphoesterase
MVAEGPVAFNAVVISVDPRSGKASEIKQVQRTVEV